MVPAMNVPPASSSLAVSSSSVFVDDAPPGRLTRTSAVLFWICSAGELLKLLKLTPDEASMPTRPAVVMLELVALATTLPLSCNVNDEPATLNSSTALLTEPL